MVELFQKSETDGFIRQHNNKLNLEIKNLSDNDVLYGDFEKWVSYFFAKYKIQPITLYMDKITNSMSKTKVKEYHPLRERYYDIDGIKVSFRIPFHGDNRLLYLKPPTFYLKRFTVDSINESTDTSYGVIEFSIDYTNQAITNKDKDSIIKDFTREFSYYAECIDNNNKMINGFNYSLENSIRALLQARKKQSMDFIELSEKLEIPLKQNPNAPNTIPIVLEKAVVKKPRIPEIKQPEKEYQISSGDYDNIRRIINLAGTSMENAARTFNRFSEEELRDVIVSNLNTHYQGTVSGETFRKVGKTDILILFEKKAAYIAECKIWHGESKFNEAIHQLFSYTTWRDIKTSIIIFNKENKNFRKLLSVIDEFLEKTESCQQKEIVAPNEWLCEFKKEKDSTERVTVQIIVFDLHI